MTDSGYHSNKHYQWLHHYIKGASQLIQITPPSPPTPKKKAYMQYPPPLWLHCSRVISPQFPVPSPQSPPPPLPPPPSLKKLSTPLI